MAQGFDTAYGELTTLARELVRLIDEERVELRELLAGRRTIPHGVASPAAAAADTFARIRAMAKEVILSADKVEKVIKDMG